MKMRFVIVMLTLILPLIGWSRDVVVETDIKVPDVIIKASELFNSTTSSEEKWSGIEVGKYDDLSFCAKDGTAHINGCINDYIREDEKESLSITTMDDVFGNLKVYAVDITEDGRFSADIPLPYPQYVKMHLFEKYQDFFVEPGDTLDIVTTAKTGVDRNNIIALGYFGFEGKINDAIAVNVIADSLVRHYNLDLLNNIVRFENNDEMTAKTIAVNDSLARLLDRVMTELPDFIGKLPVSSKVKDFVAVKVASHIFLEKELMIQNWCFAKNYSICPDEKGNCYYRGMERLDMGKLMAPFLKYKSLIYDCPLMICSGFPLINYWEFSNTFGLYSRVMEGFKVIDEELTDIEYEKSFYEKLKSVEYHHEKEEGIGDCFAVELIRTKNLLERIDNFRVGYDNLCSEGNITDDLIEEIMKVIIEEATAIIRMDKNEVLNTLVLNAYADFMNHIKRNDLGSQNEFTLSKEDREILDEIISPYKGNLLLLDFWAIWCSPCRGGIIDMKDLVKEYADKPFKALYIANKDDRRAECEKWLKEEGIEGEHIFVSNYVWNRLMSMFNFSCIPYSVLIDKDGRIIYGNHWINLESMRFNEALEEL